MGTPAPAVRRRGLEQWAGLAGIAFVALFIGGVILSDSGVPDFDAAPGKVISYWQDSGHRDKAAFGWGLVLLGVFSFLWFLTSLRQTVRRLDGDGFLTGLLTVGGSVYAALTLVAVSLDVTVKTMSDDTYRDEVYPGIVHAGRDAAYIVHSAGDIGMAAVIVATSLAALRAGAVPRWAGRVSIGIGILALGSIFFLPQILIALWLIVVGVLLFRAAPA
jgi:hypothetical protein